MRTYLGLVVTPLPRPVISRHPVGHAVTRSLSHNPPRHGEQDDVGWVQEVG